MKLKERLAMTTLGFTAAIILILVLDLNMLLPTHDHYIQEQSPNAHGRVKISKNG